MNIENIKRYIGANPGKSVLLISFIILGIIGLGALLLPDIFWDQFIWRYFWGPIEADAEDKTVQGITEGYNIVSTLSYGLILAVAIFVIYRLIVILQIKLDKWFFVAVIPFIMFGGLARALEDALLFDSPLVYLFISPLIYIMTGLIALALLIISHKLTENKKGKDRQIDIKFPVIFSVVLAVINLMFVIIYYNPEWTNYSVSPIYSILVSIIVTFLLLGYFKFSNKASIKMPMVFGAFGVVLMSYPSVAVAGWYSRPETWRQVYLASEADPSVVFRPEALAIVIGLALVATIIWAAAAFVISKKSKWKQAAVFFSGTNLALVFGQFTDASATFIAIDYYSYWEKHVVPSLLIDLIDTAAVMFILKTFALIFAIYLLDIYLKEDLKKHQQIVPLIKLAVLVLGLAPGTRDMLRLAMGV
jgi:uncharacterized membrane protein